MTTDKQELPELFEKCGQCDGDGWYMVQPDDYASARQEQCEYCLAVGYIPYESAKALDASETFQCPGGLTCSGDGWDCVGDGLCEAGTLTFDTDKYHFELKQWFVRRNKGQPLPWEVCRHSDPEVVNPIVMGSFDTPEKAEKYHERWSREAGVYWASDKVIGRVKNETK